MKKGRISCLVLVLAVCAVCVFSGNGLAEEKYPSRTIELVAPTNPGGSSDVAARVYSDDLSRVLKVPVNVTNRAGNSGVTGTVHVINAKKDGYTLLAAASSALIIAPAIDKEISLDPLNDLAPIGLFVDIPSIFAVRSDSPFKTLNELIEYGRKNPGKLKNAAGGVGTESYFNLELLCAKSKIKIVSVPFHGGGEAMPALLGGHVDMSSNTLSVLGPQIKAGKIRGLAITSKKRHPDFPNIPTTAELGYPDVSFVAWFGLFTPSGMPKPIMDVLIPAAEKVFKNPEVVQRAARAGLTANYKGPEELRKLLEAQIPIVKKVAQDANLKAE